MPISGCCATKRGSRGISHADATVGMRLIVRPSRARRAREVGFARDGDEGREQVERQVAHVRNPSSLAQVPCPGGLRA
jgi:hypothetical protein